jgi:serine/threonine protein kinase
MSTTSSNHVTPTTLWNGVGVQEGQIIQGKYKISKLLGEGGMGQVFLADQENLRRKVVLKILKPSLCTNQIQVQRFQREAELASQLNHPHTITVYDFGVEQGIPYIAMEFLEGECLSDALEKGRVFNSEEILEMMKQICSSLAQAHEKGMIHRDLKPENIFLLNKGNRIFVKVLDFGIAKVMESQHSGHQKLTQGDMIFGTPHYMSPEQIKGEELDQRSDVYALGVMLYQIITTQLPFQSDSVIEILTKHITNEVPNLDLSRYQQEEKQKLQSLDSFITKAMAKNRNERIPTVTAFAEQLSQSLERQIGFRNPSLIELQPINKAGFPFGKTLVALLVLLIAGYVALPYLPPQIQDPVNEQLAKIHPSLPHSPIPALLPPNGEEEKAEEKAEEKTEEKAEEKTQDAQLIAQNAEPPKTDSDQKPNPTDGNTQPTETKAETKTDEIKVETKTEVQVPTLPPVLQQKDEDIEVIDVDDATEIELTDVVPLEEQDDKSKLEEDIAIVKENQKKLMEDLEETKKKAQIAQDQANEAQKKLIEEERLKLEAEKQKLIEEKAKLEAEREALKKQAAEKAAADKAATEKENADKVIAEKIASQKGVLVLSSTKLKTKIRIGKALIHIDKKGKKRFSLRSGTYQVICRTADEKIAYKVKVHTNKQKELTCFK